MKMFLFSLQRLLDAKEALEKAAEIKQGEAQRKLNKAEARLLRLGDEMKLQHLRHVARMEKGELDRHEMTYHLLFMNRVERHLVRQEDVVAKHRVKMEEARRLLLHAVRERKSLENLREREKRQWVLDSKRADRREMDEIAIGRFVRQEKLA